MVTRRRALARMRTHERKRGLNVTPAVCISIHLTAATAVTVAIQADTAATHTRHIRALRFAARAHECLHARARRALAGVALLLALVAAGARQAAVAYLVAGRTLRLLLLLRA